jgi:hypothetical protein
MAAELPPVSAGVPAGLAAEAGGAGAEGLAVATSAFDEALAASGSGIGPAGRVVDRFAPPVASAGAAPLALAAASQPFGMDGGVLRPCDTPGSGCRNLTGTAGPPNPPILPGVRPTPTPQLPTNPPIQPGGRPVPTPPQL